VRKKVSRNTRRGQGIVANFYRREEKRKSQLKNQSQISADAKKNTKANLKIRESFVCPTMFDAALRRGAASHAAAHSS